MLPHPSSLEHRVLVSENPDAVARLRVALETHGYLGPEAERVLGSPFGEHHLRADLPLYLRRLAEPRPLHGLVKLFGLYVPVAEADARACLAPLALEDAEDLGLVERADGAVRARVGLAATGPLVVARDRPRDGGSLRVDHVLGLNRPALLLAALTPRTTVASALDLGCGGGVQALLAAAHTRRVVATDINPRALAFARFNALLNGTSNVEWREGDLYAPVEGERFSLVVANPPFTVSPDRRFAFRDGGREGDELSRDVVRGAARHLEDGGFAVVLCSWILRGGEDWADPLRRWVEGCGCDAWLLQSAVEDPLHYAAGWNRGAEADYGEALDRWTAYYRERGAAAIGLGAVVLRRRDGVSWVRADEMSGDPASGAGEHVRRVFAGEDFLRACGAGDRLLDRAFRVAPDVLVSQSLRPADGGGLAAGGAVLALDGGLGFRGRADLVTLELLRRCDGRTPLRTALAALADRAGHASDRLAAAVLAAVRGLVGLGFLLPVTGEDERRVVDGSAVEVA
jgi:methylase of polypeptide subunit release factors